MLNEGHLTKISVIFHDRKLFLTDRKIRVIIDGSYSSCHHKNAHIPQGSVLAPRPTQLLTIYKSNIIYQKDYCYLVWDGGISFAPKLLEKLKYKAYGLIDNPKINELTPIAVANKCCLHAFILPVFL